MKASQASRILESPGAGHANDLRASHALFESLQRDTRGFQELSDHLRAQAGISLPLNDKNVALMAARLAPLMRERGLGTYAQLQARMQRDPRIASEFISSLTTNTTHFFRENVHFDELKKLLPELIAQKRRGPNPELRVWCAASSTGQEPYTILMSILETVPDLLASGQLKFLATDIDLDVLARAASGTYSEQEVQGIPPALASRYLRRIKGESGSYRFDSKLRSAIRFAQLNLMSEHYPFQHPFDIIFCRNVLIYFEAATASAVVDRMVGSLRPGGYLFLGHSESGTMRNPKLATVSHALYQKQPNSRTGGKQ